MEVPQQHISQLFWLVTPFEFRTQPHYSMHCFGMWGCFSVCQQRVSDTVRNILLSSTNNILEWNGPSSGCNESWVMCCFWLTSGLIHAERRMQASVHIQASEILRGKHVNVDTSNTDMHTYWELKATLFSRNKVADVWTNGWVYTCVCACVPA